MSPTTTKKASKLLEALKDIEQTFGAGSVMRGLNGSADVVDTIPTGVTALDEALGGGWPRGRVSEVFGSEGVGKSSTVYHAIAQAQGIGPCALVDVECSFDPVYARAIGVDTDALLFSQPDSSEQAWEIMQRLVTSEGLVLLALDSLAVMLPQAELEGEAGEAHMGLKARQIGQGLRRLVPVAKRTGTAILLVNQVRESIGVIFGSPIVVPGGRAPKFASTIRLEVKRGPVAKRAGADPHKQEIKWKCIKNKQAPPYREACAWIEFGKGIVGKK